MRLIQTKSYDESAQIAGDFLLAELARKPELLMGLATGETAVGLYQHMIRAHKEGRADFSRARSVNLDEYVGCAEADSYIRFMRTNLFDHINLPAQNIEIARYDAEPLAEQARLRAFFAQNRVDVQLLGIGPNGHIGFNEPADTLEPHVHVTDLSEATIEANARFFAEPGLVPRQALTMGMADILCARKILLVVKGESKRAALRALLDGKAVSTHNPATFLLLHPDVTVVCEEQLVAVAKG